MTAAWLLLLQTAAQTPPRPPIPAAPIPRVPVLDVTRPCPPAANGDIVVCGTAGSPSPYRLPLPRAPEDEPRKVRFRLPGNIKGDAHLEQLNHDGIPDHRIMIHLTKPF